MIKDESVPGRQLTDVYPSSQTLEGSGESLTPQAALFDLGPVSCPVRGRGQDPEPSQRGSFISTIQQTYDGLSPDLDVTPDSFPDSPEPLPQDMSQPTLTPELFPIPAILGLDSFPKEPCSNKYIVQECGCVGADGKRQRSVLPSSCMNLACPKCAPWTSRRRAMTSFDRLTLHTLRYQNSKYVKRPVIYTVFTIPPALRESFTDRKAWQKLRGLAWQILKRYFGAAYGLEASHPTGEKSSRFHPHMNFLWVQYSGSRPFLDVNRLRLEWAKIFGVGMVDCWCAYTYDTPLIMKWAKYVTRVFVGYHWWTGPLRWFGCYPKGNRKEVCECPQCGERFRTIGTIQGNIVDDYWKIGIWLGVKPPWECENNIQRYGRKAKKERAPPCQNV